MQMIDFKAPQMESAPYDLFILSLLFDQLLDTGHQYMPLLTTRRMADRASTDSILFLRPTGRKYIHCGGPNDCFVRIGRNILRQVKPCLSH